MRFRGGNGGFALDGAVFVDGGDVDGRVGNVPVEFGSVLGLGPLALSYLEVNNTRIKKNLSY